MSPESPSTKSQIPNPKSQTNPKHQSSKTVCGRSTAFKVGIWDLGFGIWSFSDFPSFPISQHAVWLPNPLTLGNKIIRQHGVEFE